MSYFSKRELERCKHCNHPRLWHNNDRGACNKWVGGVNYGHQCYCSRFKLKKPEPTGLRPSLT